MEKIRLKNCTARDFAIAWKKYDADDNGYIEDKELSSFLADLAEVEGETEQLEHFKMTFMSKYDKNKDGKIDMRELAEHLSQEENFLLLFRNDSSLDCADFDKIWKKYDKDSSGFIESSELKEFLKDMYGKSGKDIDSVKLQEYTSAVLHLYDRDDDHKLDYHEMIKLASLAS